MEKKMTHYDRILRHLKDCGSITSITAIYEYGVTRLSAVIYDLRQDGYNIKSENVNSVNRYGDKVHFARYILKD